MGNRQLVRTNDHTSWSDRYGCDHYTDDTEISKLKWKTVPMSKEETKAVLTRMNTITDKIAVSGTMGLKKDKKSKLHDCIEVCILELYR